MRVADHVFVITGAASGLGRAVAEHLGAQGAKLVLADLDPRGAEAAAPT
jgi:NAD(P)-dependent dehydrogenase (short-subunit alcohol dehydrogenase family)